MDRNFKQELLNALYDHDDSGKSDTYYSSPTRRVHNLTPTGDENVVALQQAYLFAVLETAKFNMATWVNTQDGAYDAELGRDRVTVSKSKGVSCGTTMCLAGSVAFFNLAENEGLSSTGDVWTLQKIKGEDYLDKYIQTSESRAKGILNLNEGQAETLFRLPTDLTVVKAALNYVANRDLSTKELANA